MNNNVGGHEGHTLKSNDTYNTLDRVGAFGWGVAKTGFGSFLSIKGGVFLLTALFGVEILEEFLTGEDALQFSELSIENLTLEQKVLSGLIGSIIATPGVVIATSGAKSLTRSLAGRDNIV